MMQPKFSAVERMAKMCQVSVPKGYSQMFEGLDDDEATRKMLTASLIADMTGNLRDQGVNSFHLYTLNRPEIAFVVSRVLGLSRETPFQITA